MVSPFLFAVRHSALFLACAALSEQFEPIPEQECEPAKRDPGSDPAPQTRDLLDSHEHVHSKRNGKGSQSQAGEPANGAVDATGAVALFHDLVVERGRNQQAHGQRAEEKGGDVEVAIVPGEPIEHRAEHALQLEAKQDLGAQDQGSCLIQGDFDLFGQGHANSGHSHGPMANGTDQWRAPGLA